MSTGRDVCPQCGHKLSSAAEEVEELLLANPTTAYGAGYLARKFGVKPPTMTRILNELVSRDIAKWEELEGLGDARRKYVRAVVTSIQQVCI